MRITIILTLSFFLFAINNEIHSQFNSKYPVFEIKMIPSTKFDLFMYSKVNFSLDFIVNEKLALKLKLLTTIPTQILLIVFLYLVQVWLSKKVSFVQKGLPIRLEPAFGIMIKVGVLLGSGGIIQSLTMEIIKQVGMVKIF